MQQLIDAPHPSVSAKQAIAAMQAAFAFDPTGGGQVTIDIIAGATPPPNGGEYLPGFVAGCELGSGGHFAARQALCQGVVWVLFKAYKNNGVEAFFDAALAVYNYARPFLLAVNIADMNRSLLELAAQYAP